MKISKTEVTRIVENKYTLTLTEEQAMIMVALMGNIGGYNSWRKTVVDPIYYDLVKAIGRDEYEDWFKDKRKLMSQSMELKSDGEDYV